MPAVLTAHPIPPTHLDAVRTADDDGFGNRLRPLVATGEGEPLRCCLRHAEAGEDVTLISYAPLPGPSVWREVGPVYVHLDACPGYAGPGLPDGLLRTGPRLLRTYAADATMVYAHHTLVGATDDLEPTLDALLAEPDVAQVHVRTVLPQCFLYAVTASG